MKKIYVTGRWRQWLLLFSGLLLFTLWRYAHQVEFRISDEEIKSLTANVGDSVRIYHYQVNKRNIRFAEFGSDTLPVTILVHGSPSSMNFFRAFYTDSTLLSRTMLVGVDRPGYGYSDFGHAVTSIVEQARLLQPVIDKYAKENRKIYMVASSYGGSVAARLAMMNPKFVKGLLFISSSFAPGQEYTYPVVSDMLDSRWSRWFFPKVLRVANDEKLSHKSALEEIQDGWENIRARVILLHGKSDGLIYFSNAEYAKRKLKNAKFLKVVALDGLGHSILDDRPELVEQNILELIR
ncbi:alpha/beta fold hydrolase [Ravibacter arvi]|uniref:Alpha/beta fold hydrolase n=1 Tax=Ravibacter arvi TaxID=2051041 RepID=A0ABP8LTW0_9BACT